MKFSNIAVVLLIFLGAGYGVLCIGMYLFQERLIFFPTTLSAEYQFHFDRPFTEITLLVGDEKLHALHFSAPSQPKGVVLYWHGNAGALHAWGAVASFFVDQGYDVVMPDYRGYGKSSGRIRNEAILLQDAEAVYAYVRSHYAPEQIVLYGRSLGSGLATYLATVQTPRLLILEAPYYSMRDLARRQMPFVPGFLLKYPLRNDLRIAEVTCPVLIIHGADDEVIPATQGHRLASLLPAPIPFVLVPGGRHNDLDEFATYRHAVQNALLNARL